LEAKKFTEIGVPKISVGVLGCGISRPRPDGFLELKFEFLVKIVQDFFADLSV
jgi:hypothetical protein